MTNHQERVNKARQTTINNIPGYWESTLAQRQPGGIGSICTIDNLENTLMAADWAIYDHPAIADGCVAFAAHIPGLLGIIELEALDPAVVLTVQDPKGVGGKLTVSGYNRPGVDFTVIILGNHEGNEVIFTFHPGEPVTPETVTDLQDGDTITVKEAIERGFTYANIA